MSSVPERFGAGLSARSATERLAATCNFLRGRATRQYGIGETAGHRVNTASDTCPVQARCHDLETARSPYFRTEERVKSRPNRCSGLQLIAVRPANRSRCHRIGELARSVAPETARTPRPTKGEGPASAESRRWEGTRTADSGRVPARKPDRASYPLPTLGNSGIIS